MKNFFKENKKILLTIWTVFTLGLVTFTSTQIISNYKNGDQEIREKLLVAATYELALNKNIKHENIQKIHVTKGPNGAFPFNYAVIVDMKNGDQHYYEFKDKDMKEVEMR